MKMVSSHFLIRILSISIISHFISSAGLAQSDFYNEQIKPGLKKSVDSTSLYLVAGGILGTTAARPQDDSTYERWKQHQVWPRETSQWGDYYGQYGISAFIALGQFYFDRENGINTARAVLANTLVTTTMKLAFRRQRPSNGNNLSFPSGHTSDAFTTATTLTYAYGWKLGILAYPVATFVAVSRLADEAHWLSDITAGAFVGIWMGRAFFYEPEEKNESQSFKWQIQPEINHDEAGLRFAAEF